MTQISAEERNNKLEAEEGGSSSRVGQNYLQERLLGRISCKCSDRDQKRLVITADLKLGRSPVVI